MFIDLAKPLNIMNMTDIIKRTQKGMPIIPALGKMRQKDLALMASLAYLEDPVSKIKNKYIVCLLIISGTW